MKTFVIDFSIKDDFEWIMVGAQFLSVYPLKLCHEYRQVAHVHLTRCVLYDVHRGVHRWSMVVYYVKSSWLISWGWVERVPLVEWRLSRLVNFTDSEYAFVNDSKFGVKECQ